jgi:hypothetical protein
MNGGQVALEDMNLDGHDNDQNFDPFYNPGGINNNAPKMDIELKAQ